jgi:hypothetical protein
MDAQRIYRTFRPYALERAARHDTPIEDALRALARAASQCPADLARSEIARYVRTQSEMSVVQSKVDGRELRRAG